MELYVANDGIDTNTGSKESPFKSVKRAQQVVGEMLASGISNIHVNILEGIYYFNEPLIFTYADSGKEEIPVVYEGIGHVVFSGGKSLELDWNYYKDGIYRAQVKEKVEFDKLSVNGIEQVLSRYPSYDPKAKYFDGYAKDSFDANRIRKYKHAAGAYMHVMHDGLWGDFHYEIVDVDSKGHIEKVGGHQNNRPSKMHDVIRYIENVFEELTEENEWFLDKQDWMLYFKPSKDIDLNNSHFIGAVLKNLISFIGSEDKPVSNIELKNICIENVGRTFMEPMEQLLRSDWCVYRGGAVFLEGTENISITGCALNQLGGNGIFVSKYNRYTSIKECYINEAGASSIIFVGDVGAVRSPLFSYEESHKKPVDWTSGPKNNNYPLNCKVEDCLLIRSGRIEKQSAGVSISMSQNITIKHNCIYDVPRAGINICDGTWGGHRIEFNEVFDTVLETSDHGAFNSWGRDRFWDSDYGKMVTLLADNNELPLLDAVFTTHINHNIFQCDHGWDIDLDDGSSNYAIYDNLCLSGGIKNREGVCRHVYGNIMFNNTYHPHLWFANSMDRFENNIIFEVYKDIGLTGWGELFDYNILYKKGGSGAAKELQLKSGQDIHSILKEVSYEQEDYATCGIRSGHFRSKAKSPFDRRYKIKEKIIKNVEIHEFNGMKFKALSGLGELSVTGMYEERGMLIISISQKSSWANIDIRPHDVIIEIDDVLVESANHLIDLLHKTPKYLVLWREQGKHIVFL